MRTRNAWVLLTYMVLTLVLVVHLGSIVPSSTDAYLLPNILVDQFGYRPQDPKIAVVRSDIVEANTSQSLQLSVLDARTKTIIFSGPATLWSQGQVHSQSGDKGWWFDFSSVSQPGEYIIQSSDGAQSFPFEIAENIYHKVLMAAMRMYFYQRSGFAKRPPYADSRWQDEAAFVGPRQDTEARFVNDKENVALTRDVQGGWFDAGDTNKYVTFAGHPVHQLLHAYTQNPSAWTDDFNIPESGNGIPDVLDEVRFELDWLRRMQDEDGGAFIKVGTLDHNYAERPSLDDRPRFYGPKCSSSTIAIASMFSHAALVFEAFPDFSKETDDLTQRAVKAWQWFESNPIETNCDTQEIQSGDADKTTEEQIGDAVAAAVYLFALTGDSKYTNYTQSHLFQTQPFLDNVWSRYQTAQGDALLFYTQLPNAEVGLKNQILERFKLLVSTSTDAYGDSNQLDFYRAYMPDDQYHWGSNAVKANYGNSNYDVVLYNAAPNEDVLYQTRALDSLHYFHGVNPLGIVYLTNMYSYGAKHSANEMWHEWFGKGVYSNALNSPNGPAPGYVTGGPNKYYTGTAGLSQQPPMKAYLDSNSTELSMWEVTEPSIGYQAAYIKLLSKFVTD